MCQKHSAIQNYEITFLSFNFSSPSSFYSSSFSSMPLSSTSAPGKTETYIFKKTSNHS